MVSIKLDTLIGGADNTRLGTLQWRAGYYRLADPNRGPAPVHTPTGTRLSMCLIIASPKPEQETAVEPGIIRSKS